MRIPTLNFANEHTSELHHTSAMCFSAISPSLSGNRIVTH